MHAFIGLADIRAVRYVYIFITAMMEAVFREYPFSESRGWWECGNEPREKNTLEPAEERICRASVSRTARITVSG